MWERVQKEKVTQHRRCWVSREESLRLFWVNIAGFVIGAGAAVLVYLLPENSLVMWSIAAAGALYAIVTTFVKVTDRSEWMIPAFVELVVLTLAGWSRFLQSPVVTAVVFVVLSVSAGIQIVLQTHSLIRRLKD
jgi:hypothetical protein